MVGCEGKPQEQGRIPMSPMGQRPKYMAMEARSEICVTRNSGAGQQRCLPGPCLPAGLLPARWHSDLSSTLQEYGGLALLAKAGNDSERTSTSLGLPQHQKGHTGL